MTPEEEQKMCQDILIRLEKQYLRKIPCPAEFYDLDSKGKIHQCVVIGQSLSPVRFGSDYIKKLYEYINGDFVFKKEDIVYDYYWAEEQNVMTARMAFKHHMNITVRGLFVLLDHAIYTSLKEAHKMRDKFKK